MPIPIENVDPELGQLLKWFAEEGRHMPRYKVQGRNERCDCGSGKKYKKCCGIER